MKFVQTAVVAAILAAGMVGSAGLVSKFFLKVRHEKVNAIVVKGYAEKDVTSDIGKFTCTFATEGATQREAYDALLKSQAAVLAHLKAKGFGEKEILPVGINTGRTMKRDEKGNETNEIHHYWAGQSVEVTSGDVERIRSAAGGVMELIKQGVDISAGTPRFYVSDLKAVKMELLEKATKDGHSRALALAGNSGGKVGALLSAEQGVIQITERNSTETSGDGVYDTRSIAKTAKVVVTLEYAVDQEKP
jgi:hypothetical protein